MDGQLIVQLDRVHHDNVPAMRLLAGTVQLT